MTSFNITNNSDYTIKVTFKGINIYIEPNKTGQIDSGIWDTLRNEFIYNLSITISYYRDGDDIVTKTIKNICAGDITVSNSAINFGIIKPSLLPGSASHDESSFTTRGVPAEEKISIPPRAIPTTSVPQPAPVAPKLTIDWKAREKEIEQDEKSNRYLQLVREQRQEREELKKQNHEKEMRELTSTKELLRESLNELKQQLSFIGEWDDLRRKAENLIENTNRELTYRVIPGGTVIPPNFTGHYQDAQRLIREITSDKEKIKTRREPIMQQFSDFENLLKHPLFKELASDNARLLYNERFWGRPPGRNRPEYITGRKDVNLLTVIKDDKCLFDSNFHEVLCKLLSYCADKIMRNILGELETYLDKISKFLVTGVLPSLYRPLVELKKQVKIAEQHLNDPTYMHVFSTLIELDKISVNSKKLIADINTQRLNALNQLLKQADFVWSMDMPRILSRFLIESREKVKALSQKKESDMATLRITLEIEIVMNEAQNRKPMIYRQKLSSLLEDRVLESKPPQEFAVEHASITKEAKTLTELLLTPEFLASDSKEKEIIQCISQCDSLIRAIKIHNNLRTLDIQSNLDKLGILLQRPEIIFALGAGAVPQSRIYILKCIQEANELLQRRNDMAFLSKPSVDEQVRQFLQSFHGVITELGIMKDRADRAKELDELNKLLQGPLFQFYVLPLLGQDPTTLVSRRFFFKQKASQLLQQQSAITPLSAPKFEEEVKKTLEEGRNLMKEVCLEQEREEKRWMEEKERSRIDDIRNSLKSFHTMSPRDMRFALYLPEGASTGLVSRHTAFFQRANQLGQKWVGALILPPEVEKQVNDVWKNYNRLRREIRFESRRLKIKTNLGKLDALLQDSHLQDKLPLAAPQELVDRHSIAIEEANQLIELYVQESKLTDRVGRRTERAIRNCKQLIKDIRKLKADRLTSLKLFLTRIRSPLGTTSIPSQQVPSLLQDTAATASPGAASSAQLSVSIPKQSAALSQNMHRILGQQTVAHGSTALRPPRSIDDDDDKDNLSTTSRVYAYTGIT